MRHTLPAILWLATLTCVAQDITTLQTKAAAGDPAAQFELGMTFHDGKGVPANDLKSAEWVRKAADQGYAPAENELGVMYRLGEGVERDKAEAVRWFHLAAQHGSAKAMYNLGAAFYNGDGVAIDDAASLRWFLLSQAFGDDKAADAVARGEQDLNAGPKEEAYFQAGETLASGALGKQDTAGAARYYEKAAQLGYSPAQVRLAIAYLDGRGVPQNDELATHWSEAAFKAKSAWAAFLLGYMYHQGRGKKQDIGDAIKWYKKASDGGISAAMINLGVIYSRPEGVKQDYVAADYWFGLADRLHDPKGAKGRGVVETHLTPDQVAKNQKKLDDWIVHHGFTAPVLRNTTRVSEKNLHR
ncbi:MAG TPA: tetratricopeptide repeat protein [Terriglobales bacterium]|nr:tetratricopeptide repeat protein [Terriglobales bacterium]